MATQNRYHFTLHSEMKFGQMGFGRAANQLEKVIL